MSVLLDNYQANGYSIIKLANKNVVYKYQPSNDVSLDGALYMKTFVIDGEDKAIDEVVFIQPLSNPMYSALQGDTALDLFVMQTVK